MELGTGFQDIADILQTTIKFAGRMVVMRQLIAVALILLLAHYLSKPLVSWLGRRYGHWLEDRRQESAEEGRESVTEETQVRLRLRIFRLMLRISQFIVYPLTAILFMALTILLFNAIGWVSGLLADVSNLLLIFLAYRLILGILYAFFAGRKLRRFHTRLFRPLFFVVIILLIISDLTELSSLFNAPLLPLFGGELTIGGLFLATIGLYLWFAATELFVEILKSVLSARPDADPGAIEASLIILRYILIVVAVILLFQLIGFNATALAAVLGGLSVGIGFALQDVLKNFLGGIILLFEGSVRPGDWIEIDNKRGVVEGLSIRNTVVRSLDNIEYIVPNQEYLSSTIVAYTYSEPSLMLKIPVGVSYDSNVRQVHDVLIEVARNDPDIQPLPEPVAPLVSFGESTINFELRVWVADIRFSGAVESRLRVMIFDAFAEHGIVMPNNQLDVHVYRERENSGDLVKTDEQKQA